jgi:multiple sugar transport system permease protein
MVASGPSSSADSAAPGARRAIARGVGRALPEVFWKWALLLPAVIVLGLLLIFPILFTLVISFTDWHLFRPGEPVAFVGLEQWKRVVTDEFILHTLRNTLVFCVSVVPTQYIIGLVVALALNNCTRGKKFFRVFFLMPLMISPVAISLVIGRMIFHEDIGPLNDIIMRLGGEPLHWLTDARLAMVTLIMIEVWHGTSFMILMLMAGLQSLPQEPYESAKVDGASEWQCFRYLTFPLLVPISVTAVLIRGLDAFKVVDIIKVVTGGGPGQATESITLAVYDVGVKGGDLAYGAAGAYTLLFMMMAFTVLLLAGTRRWVRGTS